MTTLYRPVRIETAEQAEQLPDGTMAFKDGHDAYGRLSRSVAVKHRGSWWCDDIRVVVVGWTALLPVEAHTQDLAPIPCWGERERRHRHVTAWLPGPSPDRRGDCA